MMFWFVWTISLVLYLFFTPQTTCVLSSDLNDDKYYFGPLKVGVPWEFNVTLSSNETLHLSADLENETYFTLVEVHSFLLNVSLSSDPRDEQLGTDIGIIILPKYDAIQFSIYNPNKVTVKILGFITPYDKDAPIPGETVKPQLELEVTKNLIEITAQPAIEVDIENLNCTTNFTIYRLFFMHSPEKDFSIETYFDGIRTMINPKTMKKEAYEYKMPLSLNPPDNNIQVLFANYPGTGVFFSLLAEGCNKSSLYVTGHTFGCNYTSDKDSCVYLAITSNRVEVSVLCVVGLILCFCGYDWKSFELGVMAFLLTSVITYAILYNVLPLEENIFACIGSGLLIGSISICVSCTKWLHLRHIIAFTVFGLLFSSTTLFFSEAGNSAAFRNDEVYWATFIAIAATSFVVQYVNRTLSHYFTTSLIGSFMAVLTLDYFAGSSLKFIFFDNIRRLCVNNFTEAYLNPPFQTPEVVLSVLWFTIAVSSVAYQYFGRIMCCEHNDYSQSELVSEDIVNSVTNDNTDTQNEFRYASFDDTLPLIDPDPYQRWLLSSYD